MIILAAVVIDMQVDALGESLYVKDMLQLSETQFGWTVLGSSCRPRYQRDLLCCLVSRAKLKVTDLR